MTTHDRTDERCTPFEVELSAFLDDELTHGERLRAVDHLAVCHACREHYRASRSLGLLVSQTHAEDDQPGDDIWDRIQDAAYPGEAPHTTEHSTWRSALVGLAAAALVAFGLWSTTILPASGDQTDDVLAGEARVEVELESDAGAMTDERFVALTAEVLRADRLYHHKMLEVMRAVADERERFDEALAGDRDASTPRPIAP